jgi:uncharacterized protein (DUF433 family)
MTPANTSNPASIEPDDPRVARPVLTLHETAAYLGMPRSTIHNWASSANGNPPLITRFSQRGREATVPFIGFAEAYVLSAFRRAGVPLQRIRPAVEVLSSTIGVDHALASRRLYTDGAEVLYDYGIQGDGDRLIDLVVVRTQQHQFSELVRDYLKRIQYGADGWATAVRLPPYHHAEVIVDPQVAFGLPVVRGARVEDLLDRFRAGDSMAEIAEDFNVSAAELEDVIRVATRAAA